MKWGWIPWRKGYGGVCRAVRYPTGQVYRVGNKNTMYPVSETLARKFQEIR